MKYTQEQLTPMSAHDINYAVAAKFLPCEYYLDNKTNEINLANFIGDTDELRGYAVFNPCNNPKDYMSIAMDNEIDIDHDCGRVYCTWGKNSAQETTRYMPKEDVGRAVCEAFLMSVTVTGEGKYK